MEVHNSQPSGDIVISGIAGRFPESDNMNQLYDHLYNKTDLITCDTRRWDISHPEIPSRAGKMNDITKFDASFFGIHYRQANSMDPMGRMLTEKAFEAIVDAGINPIELKGKRVGVFIGISFLESEQTWFYKNLTPKSQAITGCTRFITANRISYIFGLKGPSIAVDTACSSSFYAIDYAVKSIKDGRCDSALVGGANLCLHPYFSLQFAKFGMLSPDGRCKCFDETANGYARSEAAVMIFLQRAKDAKRIYAKVVHVKTNCDGYKEEGITYPSSETQKQLLTEVYEECQVDPTTLSYFEAHGTGTRVGDPEEVNSLDQFFCTNRTKPLPIGSVKSNLGHSEPASGLCSIAKVILGMETDCLLPNINYNTPKHNIKALLDGRMSVVTEPTRWNDDDDALKLVGINNFGFGGANSHLLLQSVQKPKTNMGEPFDNLNRLVCVSGRTDEAVDAILNDLGQRKLDAEFVALLHNIFSYHIPGHLHRGYAVVSKRGQVTRQADYFAGDVRPVWYVFGGLANEWFNAGTNLLDIPVFADVVARVDATLAHTGIKCSQLLTSTNNRKVLDNKLFHSVLVVAMQMGLLELLRSLGLRPDGFFGYGIGEIVCGYADGCLDFEQTVLIVYHRALACAEANNPKIASDLVTKYLEKVIPVAKLRSDKWLSTSLPSTHWGSELARSASPGYFTNNFLAPAFIDDVVKLIPTNAVVLTIGAKAPSPLPKDTTTLELVPSNSTDNLDDFFNSIGRLYLCGLNPRLDTIYPKVRYPVSKGTPMISPLIKWNYDRDWYVLKYEKRTEHKSGERKIELGIEDELWTYMGGHVIDGRKLFPALGYLCIIWDCFALMVNQLITDMVIVFENVRFNRATNIPDTGTLELTCMIQRASGNFEIVEGGTAIVTGRIFTPRDVDHEFSDVVQSGTEDSTVDVLTMEERDVYKELRLRGYNYTGQFRGISRFESGGTHMGYLKWDDNWVTFMDNMLQMQILTYDTRDLYIPTFIERLTIDAKRHIAFTKKFEETSVPVLVQRSAGCIRSGGIVIRGLNASAIARRKPLGEPVLETYRFVPNTTDDLTLEESIRVCMQIVLENVLGTQVTTVEVADDGELLSPIIAEVLGDQPLIQADITVLSTDDHHLPNIRVENQALGTKTNCLVVVANNLLGNPEALGEAFLALKPNGFVLSREIGDCKRSGAINHNYDVLLEHGMGKMGTLVLLRKAQQHQLNNITTIDVSHCNNTFAWLPKLQSAVSTSERVVLLAQNQPLSGILGLFNCLRREPGCDAVRCIFITDPNAPTFDPESDIYKTQLDKDLTVNVYANGCWGTYRHLALTQSDTVEAEHGYANTTVRGDLSSLKWVEGPLKSTTRLEADKVLVNVHNAAINFRDVMLASGKLSVSVVAKHRLDQDCVQGFEFSGRSTASGKCVMGMMNRGALSTLVEADAYMLWDVPDDWSLEDAATVPCVYSTVLYALLRIGGLQPKSSILIHAGSGGVGLAAINVALHYGCNVFTTVGTQEKRDFLKKHFPGIHDERIGNSRDTTFEQMVMRGTDGRGVDIVLNSLAEEKLQASVRCLAAGGKFLEIGKFDLANNNPLHLGHFDKDVSFHGIMLDMLFCGEPVMKKLLHGLLVDGIKSGAVRPLPRTVYASDKIEDAFRFMAAGKHIGKVLLKIREDVPTNPRLKIAVVPKYYCTSNNSYVIAGGLGGFGLELADWLVLRGARKVLLNSRNGVRTGYQAMRIRTWQNYGTQVRVSTADVTTPEGCLALIAEANKMGPVEGVFNLAVVLKDAALDNQTVDNYRMSFGPKATATLHLDAITRAHCPQLRHFVIFSSVSCGRGNAGQTNYGMANSVMERICERRHEDGFPALAIQWGAIGDVGLVADMQENHTEIVIGGTLQQKLSSCLTVLDTFLRQRSPVVSSMVVAEKRVSGTINGNVVEAVANILGVHNMKTISSHATLAEVGMDSIMAAEVKQTLEREFELFLTPQEIRSMTFTRLEEISKDKEVVASVSDELPEEILLMFRNIGDEQSSAEPLVRMKTLQNGTKAKTIFVVPGIEGVSTVLEPLCSGLKAIAFCLQLGYRKMPGEIEDMARDLLQPMKTVLGTSPEDFLLVGYSFGAVVSIWLASLLEGEGRRGTLVLIDGAPKLMTEMVKLNVKTDGDEVAFQMYLLGSIMSIYLSTDTIDKCKDDLLKCSTFEERVDIVLAKTPKDVPYTKTFLRSVYVSIHRRMQALMAYKSPSRRLKSAVRLFRPKHHKIVMNISEDYDLGEIADHVRVDHFDGNHLTLLENPSLIEALNEIINKPNAA